MNKFKCLIQVHEYEQRTYEKENLKEFQKLLLKIKSSEEKE